MYPAKSHGVGHRAELAALTGGSRAGVAVLREASLCALAHACAEPSLKGAIRSAGWRAGPDDGRHEALCYEKSGLCVRGVVGDQLVEFGMIDGLRQVMIEAGLQRLDPIILRSPPCHRDEPHSPGPIFASQTARNLMAAHVGKSDVEQRDVGSKYLGNGKSGPPVVGDPHFVT
jgi:hypothetical protein